MDGEEVLNHKVVEVGGGYLVVRDGTGWIDLRIPATSVRGVVHVRTGGSDVGPDAVTAGIGGSVG